MRYYGEWGHLLTDQVGCPLYYYTRPSYIEPTFPLLQPPPPVFSLPPVAVRTRVAPDQLPPTFGSKSKAFISLLGRPSLQTVTTFLKQDGVGKNLMDT